MKRINFWSSPRNISTALMYSFAQRDDFTVVDEPLYAHYLKHTDTAVTHPASVEIRNSMEQNGAKVVEAMLHKPFATDNVLFKQMTHHLIELDWSFLAKMENVLLIR
ncbi:MAG: sulfotransferase family protein, partial [Bacteroidota bacterium]